MLIEVCLDSVEAAIAAQQGGADRVELCDNLLEGGTTPSAGMIALAREQITIKLHVIIRPRGGDFCYSPLEFEVMRRDIALARQLGADGVVIGILTPAGQIDIAGTRELVDLARPLSVTFHRAFDMAHDPLQALDDLIGLGVDRVLTSGQQPSALEGLDLIAELVRRATGRIIVLPGGGVERNPAKVVAATGCREIHVVANRPVESSMAYRNERVFMGGELRPPEYSRLVADAALVQQIRAELG
jgi:copper homeostasis protein